MYIKNPLSYCTVFRVLYHLQNSLLCLYIMYTVIMCIYNINQKSTYRQFRLMIIARDENAECRTVNYNYFLNKTLN